MTRAPSTGMWPPPRAPRWFRGQPERAVGPAPLLTVEAERIRPRRGTARVRDEDVDRPQSALNAGQQLRYGVEVLAVVHEGLGADLGGRRLDRLRRAGADRHPSALGGQRLRYPAPDALRSARDEGNPS